MIKKKLIIIVILLFFLTIRGVHTPIYAADKHLMTKLANTTYASGRIIVKTKSKVDSKVFSTGSFLPVNDKKLISKVVPLIKVVSNKDVVGLNRVFVVFTTVGKEKMLVDSLNKNKKIEYAELDYLAKETTITPIIPNDPFYKKDLNNNPLWYRGYLLMESAWGVNSGDSNTVIAIIDSGIDYSHPDLTAKIWTNPGEIANNNIDDDNNGYIDDVHGWNVNQNNNNTNDEFGHGTIVSGIAAATSNNNLGMTGLAWKNSILPVRANVGSSGIFNYSDIAKAIVYADSFPTVKVINLSMGGYANSALLRDTIKNVLNNNKAVIVAGIGNDNIDIFNTPFYPAAYRGVIAVGAHANGLARVYSYGYPIQISAPGKDIYTTFLGGDYGYCSGTSCAAPFVSGVVALMASHFPDWTGKELNQGIKIWTDNPPDSSDYCYQPPMPSCLPGQACIQVMPDSVCERVDWTPQYGFGTLNGIMPLLAKCYDSSQELRTTIEIKSPDDRASFTRSQVVNIVGTVKSDNFINYKIEYGKGASPSAWISEGVALTGNGTQVVENGVLAQWNLSKITDSGYYQYRVRIYGKSSCNGNITGDERALLYIN